MKQICPNDTFNLAYIILFLQGIGALLPWNVFITADAYFQKRFRNTAYEDSFLNFFGISFTVSGLVTIMLTTTILRKYLPSNNVRIITPIIVTSVIVLLCAILVKMPKISGNSVFGITICGVIISSICSAFYQDGVLRKIANFPEKYTQAFMAGQSLAGLFVAVSNFIITMIYSDSAHKDIYSKHFAWGISIPPEIVDSCAFTYFTLSSLVLLLCLATFFLFLNLPFTQYFTEKEKIGLKSTDDTSIESDSDSRLQLLTDGIAHGYDRESVCKKEKKKGVFGVILCLKYYAFAVFMNFCVTLALFPYPISSISSTSKSGSRFFHDLFVPFLFVLFSFGDFIGRVFAGVWNLKNPRTLACFSISRCMFFGLFLLCNIKESGAVATVVIFRTDFFPILFVFLCAISNGYLASVTMMNGSTSLPRDLQDLGSSVMLFAVCIGTTCGAMLSFGLHAAICKCNPF